MRHGWIQARTTFIGGNVYIPFILNRYESGEQSDLMPTSQFESHAKGVGFVNSFPDIDGRIRRAWLFYEGNDDLYLHSAFRMALDYLDMEFQSYSNRFIIFGKEKEEICIPLTVKSGMLINWYGKHHSVFPHYSF